MSNADHVIDFRTRTTRALAIAAFVLVAPFAVNNFVQGRMVFGAGAAAVALLLLLYTLSVYRNRYNASLILFALVPAVAAFLGMVIHELGIIGILWCYPTVLAFYAMLPERKAWLANGLLLLVSVPSAYMTLDAMIAVRASATLLAVSVFTGIFVHIINEQQRRLEALALTDTLTGLLNRTLFQSSLEEAIQHNERTQAPMSLLVLDFDHFKHVNDTLGHGAGDKVLAGAAALLLKRMRRVDKLFRIGGEEFVALLYGTPQESARAVAEQLRAAIAAATFVDGVRITASIGVAQREPGDDWNAWFKRGDDRLYKAKESGRDRVEC